MDLKYNCGDDRNSDEQLYINVHEFHFVSNKTLTPTISIGCVKRRKT